MAEATVFVDDAVLGRLPAVCVKEGVETVDSLTVRYRVGGTSGLGIAWLLLLAGPLGWIGLLVVAAARRSADTLTVRLPFSEAAYRRMRSARRESWIFGPATLVLLLVTLVALGHDDVLLGVGSGALCLLAAVRLGVALYRLFNCSVAVDLDASRRWVTLRRVHPLFAQCCTGVSTPPATADLLRHHR